MPAVVQIAAVWSALNAEAVTSKSGRTQTEVVVYRQTVNRGRSSRLPAPNVACGHRRCHDRKPPPQAYTGPNPDLEVDGFLRHA